MVLIEHGAVKTSIANGMITAKKAQEPNSPYSQMMKSMSKFIEQLLANASHPELVAKVILDAISAEKPNLRYLAGKDVEGWLEAKNKMTDNEFYNMMRQQILERKVARHLRFLPNLKLSKNILG